MTNTNKALPFSTPLSSIETPANPSTANGVPVEEEEDGPIKCFCGFQLDDGLTVFCERCETWQHIECYYFKDFRDGHPPDTTKLLHTCVDCDYRPYDQKGAADRQRERFRPEERRAKKATPKAPRRKPKLSESNLSLTNGYHYDKGDPYNDHNSGSPKDQGPPTKRPKTTHRSSHSLEYFSPPSNVESFTPKGSGPTSHASRKASKKHFSNGPSFQPYSREFLGLYENDIGETSMPANVFNDIAITRSLSSWSHDVESLSEATNGLSPGEIFHRCDEPLDHMSLPSLVKQQRLGEPSDPNGRRPRWITLSLDTDTLKGAIVGELRGKIGHMQDYVKDSANKWDYLRHPMPFVFFHPKLPIYIDTRQQGSICRYLRRSCQPNLEMRTILENSTDFRFCFIAKDDIAAGSELTISWTPDEHIRKYLSLSNNPEIKEEGNFDVAAYISDWVEKVLADFGGCACESPEQCGLAKYARKAEAINSVAVLTNGKSSKGRNGPTKCMKTYDARRNSYSRASSEGKYPKDDDTSGSRSTTGSKSGSRDMTPTHNGTHEPESVPGLGLTDREKRKIAALEKNFEQLEQEKQQPTQRRKKRNSGGSTLNTPTAPTSKQLVHNSSTQSNTPVLPKHSHYAGVPNSRRKSGSPTAYLSGPQHNSNEPACQKRKSQPNTPNFKSPMSRQNYVDASVQTAADDRDPWQSLPEQHNQKRRSYVSLGKRLLIRCQQDRERLEEHRRLSLRDQDNPPGSSMSPKPTVTRSARAATSTTSENCQGDGPRDVEMPDIANTEDSPSEPGRPDQLEEKQNSTVEPATGPKQPRSPEFKHPPPPVVAQGHLADSGRDPPVHGNRASDLRLQLPSDTRNPHNPASAPPMTVTPSSTVPRSPFSLVSNSYPPLLSSSTPGVAQPSPVKKINLGEYFSRQKSKSQSFDKGIAGGPTAQQAVIKNSASVDEESNKTNVEGDAAQGAAGTDGGNPSDSRGGPG